MRNLQSILNIADRSTQVAFRSSRHATGSSATMSFVSRLVILFRPLRFHRASTDSSTQVVLPSGAIVNATKSSYPDLWQALKGGSNNFGIVTAFESTAFKQGKFWYFNPTQTPTTTTILTDHFPGAASSATQSTPKTPNSPPSKP
jgi:hypothetical protein